MTTETAPTDKWQKFNEEVLTTAETSADDTETEAKDDRDPAIIALETQLTELSEKLLRSQAEHDNARRRAERDLDSAHKYAAEKILKALLPVVDSLEKSLEIEKDAELMRGVKMTLDIMQGVLTKNHVTAIDPQGEVFNPSLHEAMATELKPDLKANTIVKVFQKGYLLHNRLMRPAFVVVSKV